MFDGDMTGENASATVSKRFGAADADVIFCSCDNILFKIHRKDLEIAAGGFPPPDFQTNTEIVLLLEESLTLEILFQYVYPMRQPNISSEPFQSLALVTEAAEKYEVFSAIYICKMMKMFLPDHALEIFAYAAKHGYDDILGEAAPSVLGFPLEQVVPIIPGDIILPWIKYYNSWKDLVFRAAIYPSKAMTYKVKHNYHFRDLDGGNLPCRELFKYATRIRSINELFLRIGPFFLT